MADDWLKVEARTPEKPEVVGIAEALSIPHTQAFGSLFLVWRWFSQHTEDGNAKFVTVRAIDQVAGLTGFAQAMHSVGWLKADEYGRIYLPGFDRHNGEAAKQRAQTSKRVAAHRAKAREVS